jgi:hypothetical protein
MTAPARTELALRLAYLALPIAACMVVVWLVATAVGMVAVAADPGSGDGGAADARPAPGVLGGRLPEDLPEEPAEPGSQRLATAAPSPRPGAATPRVPLASHKSMAVAAWQCSLVPQSGLLLWECDPTNTEVNARDFLLHTASRIHAPASAATMRGDWPWK